MQINTHTIQDITIFIVKISFISISSLLFVDAVLAKQDFIDCQAVSPYQKYCDGFGSPGATGNGYVNILSVSAGTVTAGNDFLLDGIVAYDRAESNNAYFAQINMITASSFSGLAGRIWGYDLAKHPLIASDAQQPLYELEQFDGSKVKVFDGQPLLDAGVELFGTESSRRYHPIPGAHVICANKSATARRPLSGPLQQGEAYGVWCYIALSIAKDRTAAANLFIEDTGLWTKNDNEAELGTFLDEHRRAVMKTVLDCGENSHVAFERTYISYAYVMMKPGEVGCALTASPYVTLARDAVPPQGFADLYRMTLRDWLAIRSLPPLRPAGN